MVTQWNLFLFIYFIKIVEEKRTIFLVLGEYLCLIVFCQWPFAWEPLKNARRNGKGLFSTFVMYYKEWKVDINTPHLPSGLLGFSSSSAITFCIVFFSLCCTLWHLWVQVRAINKLVNRSWIWSHDYDARLNPQSWQKKIVNTCLEICFRAMYSQLQSIKRRKNCIFSLMCCL